MYRLDNLGSFLRLLVSHLSLVIDEGERLLEFYSDEGRQTLLLRAIETGEATLVDEQVALCRDYEALFVLQMSHAREWVDRLGRLDAQVEREADEFLAATFAIERLLSERARQRTSYRIENRINGTGCAGVLRDDLRSGIDVEQMLLAIFELLARLEERYDLVEELLAERPLPVAEPFRARRDEDAGKVIRLFDKAEAVPAGDSSLLPQ